MWNHNIQLRRCDSSHEAFLSLIKMLDADLKTRYGIKQNFFDQFNNVDTIRHVVIAFSDDQAVGCGALKPFDNKSSEVKRMFVRPQFGGRGIASLILLELQSWAAELGFEKCLLETGIAQPEAIALYKKSGYNIIENYGQYVGVDLSVCMEKIL